MGNTKKRPLVRFERERSQYRRLFTDMYKEFKEKDKKELDESLYQRMADNYEKISALDAKIKNFYLDMDDDDDEAEVEREFNEVETYNNMWREVSKYFKHIDSPKDDCLSEASSDFAYSQSFKLPKIELKKFNGSLKGWIGFSEQFKKIDQSTRIDDEMKFQYLLQSVEENSPAWDLVNSYPPSGANYPKALSHLKERFGNEELLIELYVRELLSLVVDPGNKSLPLSQLYDRILTQLRNLETLGIKSEKYSCMLYPLVESCLPERVLRDWHHQKESRAGGSVSGDKSSKLEDLLSFLKEEVEGEERMSLAKAHLTPTKVKTKVVDSASDVGLASAAALVNSSFVCIFCGQDHMSKLCEKAKAMSLEDKTGLVKKYRLCLKCLRPGHIGIYCRAKGVKCEVCGGQHVALMCQKNEEPKVVVELSAINKCVDTQVFLQTLQVKSGPFSLRALLDSGSQRSYITEEAAKKLDLVSGGKVDLVHALFGGSQTTASHNVYRVGIQGIDGSCKCNFDVLGSSMICQAAPVAGYGSWHEELRVLGITIIDSDKPIDLLIGADVGGKFLTGKRVVLRSGLVAVETLVGWTLMGRVQRDKAIVPSFSMLSTVSNLWELEAIGIHDPIEQITQKERVLEIIKDFRRTVEIKEDGRYQIKLPWCRDRSLLPTNYCSALGRLKRTVTKLQNSDLISAYGDVFSLWAQEGIIERVLDESCEFGYYLPHRPVIKVGSTTPIRPVFDASAKIKGWSLNDFLEKGDNLIENIPSILLRFRLKEIGVSSDIKKAFLQVAVHPEDRDVLRFLWIDDEGKPTIWRHARVVFGVKSSPFLLGAVINYHLERCRQEFGSEFCHVIEVLLKSFYVDNCVTSVDAGELKNFVAKSRELFEAAKFDLRGWEWTDPSASLPAFSNILGLTWDRREDVLKINPVDPKEEDLSVITRRKLFSICQRVFDPLGFTSPVTLGPKLLLQKSWSLKGSWDAELPEDIVRPFRKWLKDIDYLSKIEVPRWIFQTKLPGQASLHTFCDASQHAYAAVIFLRFEHDSGVEVIFLQSRSRVAPKKGCTIPRLELLAATIGSRLAAAVLCELNMVKDLYYWTDSSTVLTWIQREEPWAVFVDNRVKEIRRLTHPTSWFHIPGSENPADLPSRGCSPCQLIESRWWEGPAWLKDPQGSWPKSPLQLDDSEINSERKRSVVSAMFAGKSDSDWFYKNVSSYRKIIRIMSWILRARNNMKTRSSDEKVLGPLSTEELEAAENMVIRLVQDQTLTGDKKVKQLNPFIDKNGVMRVKTRIINRSDTDNFLCPYLLPSKHPVVTRIVEEEHRQNCHVGGQTLLCMLREKYWIIKGRKVVRQIVGKCVICRRQEAKKVDCPEGPLPVDRVRDAAAFEVVGVDLAGPLFLKDKRKVWICLFTCAIYRAVHLEIVANASTESFLQAFRRFVARRGRPAMVYSDNGLNFVGAATLLKSVDWESIGRYDHKIQWIFNPPSAPWWGGWWERLIGIIKRILRKVLGRTTLDFEELSTILCDVERIVNSRPITYISHVPDELSPLTPAMFIQDISEGGVPDCDEIDARGLNKRLVYRQRLRQDLRKRFRSEYLGFLRNSEAAKKKRGPPLQVGDIVLIETEQKRLYWPLAKVIEVLPGDDGEIRLVRLQTSSGVLLRPVQRIYPLEVSSREKSALLPSSEHPTSELPASERPTSKHPISDNGESDEESDSECAPKSDCANSKNIKFGLFGRVSKMPKRYLH